MLARMIPSWLDVAALVLIYAGMFAGMKIGAVSAFFDILGGAVGGWVATRAYPWLAESLNLSAGNAYFLSFFVVGGAFLAGGIFASERLEYYFLGLADKFWGAIFGMVLSFVMTASLIMPMLMAPGSSGQKLVERSPFAGWALRTTQKCFSVMPEALWTRFEPLLDPPHVLEVRKLLGEQ